MFGVESHTINYHLKEIYKIQELEEKATTRKIRAVQQEGSRKVERELLFYNLDAIISVGYRVNSRRATQFRIWATGILKEYIIKGFAMDDERLSRPALFSARIIFANCWNVSALSGQANGVSGNRSQIFLRSVW